jgi:hypothetical protein
VRHGNPSADAKKLKGSRAAISHGVDHRSVVALIASSGKGYGARGRRGYIEDLASYPEVFLLLSESQHLAAIPEAEDIVANADAYGATVSWP